MEQKRLERRGMLLIFTCTLLWSISGILIKLIPWNAMVIAGSRSLIAGGVMALYIRLSGMRYRLDRTALVSGMLMSGMFLCFIAANKLTTAANAIVIQSSAPVFVLLYNVAFGRRRARRLDVITVILTITGIGIFFFDKLESGRLLGNLVALLSGMLLALCYIVTCGAPRQSCMNGILLGHLITAAVGLPMAFVFETKLTAGALSGIAVLGVVQLGIPYVLYALAVQHCPPLACSLIGMMEAVFNPVWVFLFSGEAPSGRALLGGALVLASIAFWAVRSQRVEADTGIQENARREAT